MNARIAGLVISIFAATLCWAQDCEPRHVLIPISSCASNPGVMCPHGYQYYFDTCDCSQAASECESCVMVCAQLDRSCEAPAGGPYPGSNDREPYPGPGDLVGPPDIVEEGIIDESGTVHPRVTTQSGAATGLKQVEK